MRRASVVLSAFCALVAAGAMAQGVLPEGLQPAETQAAAPPPGPAADSADAAALNPLATLEKSSLTGFRDMPLFTPSRRRPAPPSEIEAKAPEPAPEPTHEETPPPEPELKLSGVVEGPEGAVAIVKKDGETERLRLGDQVDGWLVTGIEGYALKLTLNEREKEYRLFERSEASAKPADGSGEDGSDGGADPTADPNADPADGGGDASGADPSADQPDAQPQDGSGNDPAEEGK